MNRINEFNLEPGTYADETGQIIVVIDMITEMFTPSVNLLDRLADPLVVTRKVEQNNSEYQRMAYPLSVFKQKFTKA